MIYPDFTHGNLNVASTLSNFVGAKSDIPQLENLKKKLYEKDYRNVIFIVFDGLGDYNVNELTTDDDYYKSHVIDSVSSTVPPTTTSATTSMLSCKFPSQHLWLDWSLFIEKLNRVETIFRSSDYYTNEKIEKYNPGTDITAFIDKANTDRRLLAVVPSYCKNFGEDKTISANNVKELFEVLNSVSSQREKKFIYAYSDDPDATMHDFGVHSQESRAKFEEIQKGLKQFIANNPDTLVITTADHGHIDVKDYIKIYKDKDIMSLLARPICGEPRFAGFKITPGKQSKFESLFNKKYGEHFELVPIRRMIKNKIFGTTENKDEIENLLGDYVAIAKGDYGFTYFEGQKLPKGNHGGNKKEEMEVSLATFEKE